MRRIASVIVLAGLVAMAAGPVAAARKVRDATVKLTGGSVAAGIGYEWGEGTLMYKGRSHTFKVNGLSVAEVGATKMTATGDVYGLKKLEDFAGTYAAVSAGASAGSHGGGIATLKNEHGVEMKVSANAKGANLKLGVDGVKVSLGD